MKKLLVICLCILSPTLVFTQYSTVVPITPSYINNDHNFGFSLFMDNDTIYIGSPGESDLNGAQPLCGALYSTIINANDVTDMKRIQQNCYFGRGFGFEVTKDRFGQLQVFNERRKAVRTSNYLFISNMESTISIIALDSLFSSHDTIIQRPDFVYQRSRFGYGLAANDDWLFVGVPYLDGEMYAEGGVVVYKRTENDWNFHQRIKPPFVNTSTYFGGSVHLIDNQLFVGAMSQNIDSIQAAGAVFVYNLDNDTFQLSQQLISPFVHDYANFGFSMTGSDNHLYIGAPNDNTIEKRGGCVYVFSNDQGNWNFENTIFSPEVRVGAQFGFTIKKKGPRLLVSAINDFVDGYRSGKVYLFKE